MDEYFCPNCGTILNYQVGFSPDNGAWKCSECGKMLMDDDVYNGDEYEGVAWFCDECGDLLNKQIGFTDSYDHWNCAKCGHTNGITDDDIVDEEDNNKTIGEIIGEGLADLTIAYIRKNKAEKERVRKESVTKETNKKKDTKSFIVFWIIWFVVMGGIFAFCMFMAWYTSTPKDGEVKVLINPQNYIGTNYMEVKEKFEEMGFTDIRCIPKDDLITGWINEDGETAEITINKGTFRENDIFANDADVEIIYHSYKTDK